MYRSFVYVSAHKTTSMYTYIYIYIDIYICTHRVSFKSNYAHPPARPWEAVLEFRSNSPAPTAERGQELASYSPEGPIRVPLWT